MKILRDVDCLSEGHYYQASHFQICQFELEVIYYIINHRRELIHLKCPNLEFLVEHRPRADVLLVVISQILA